MEFKVIATALQQDLGVDIPDPERIKAWRQDWTERALGDLLFDSTFSQLYAVEFLAKCQGLPGVTPQSQLDKFLSSQDRCLNSLSASDRILSGVTDACRWLLRGFDYKDASRYCVHGPGATVDGLMSYDKWLMKLPSHEFSDQIDPLSRFPRTASLLRVNRFSEVPKTSWSLRGICIEETSAQFLQQGIGRMLRSRLSYSGIDLRRQWKTNISLLRDPNYHTIDLSAASDSISVAFMKSVFVGPDLECWYRAMADVRSEFCIVPSRKETQLCQLNTFASMGNGFCFQLLSLLCTAMCIAAIRETNPSFPWRRDQVLDEYHRHFSVYGDDIVVHERYRSSLYYVLSVCGFKVNTEKSSTEGRWRESCGAFVHHGLKHTRMTTSVPRLRSILLNAPEDLVSACSLQRRCAASGWSFTAQALAAEIVRDTESNKIVRISLEDFSKFSLVLSDPFGSSLVVVDDRISKSQLRWSTERSRNYIRARSYTRKSRDLELADTSAIAACLLGGGSLPPSEQYGNTCLLQQARVYV